MKLGDAFDRIDRLRDRLAASLSSLPLEMPYESRGAVTRHVEKVIAELSEECEAAKERLVNEATKSDDPSEAGELAEALRSYFNATDAS